MTATASINVSQITARWMYESYAAQTGDVILIDDYTTETAIKTARTIYQEGDQLNRNNAGAFRTHLARLCRESSLLSPPTSGDQTPFRDLPYSTKTEAILLLLSAVIAVNEEDPKRVENTSGPDNGIAINNWLENIWRSRQTWDTPFDKDHELKTALDWENTSQVIYYSMDELLLMHGGTFALDDEGLIARVSENIHANMIKHNLWGEDTSKYNVPYNELPTHMRDNYLLMTMVGIAAISENAKQDRSGIDECGS